jgi:serine/threonine protein kinase, bacterial
MKQPNKISGITTSFKRLFEPFYEYLFLRSFFDGTSFEFIRKVGRGSFGTAYLIYDAQNEQVYILKRLNFYRKHSEEARTGFEMEKILLEGLNEQAFPSLVSSGFWRKIPYIIMDYKAGQTFEQLIFMEGKVYSERESFEVAAKVMGRIAGLHRKNIIHRDLRIPNILTDGDNIFIIDFGLARKATDKSISHASSEDPRRPVHYTSDLYSLGHFLLFLLYSGYKPDTLIEKPWEEELTLHPESKEIIQRLLQLKEPFENSKQALQAIQKHIKNVWE